MGTILSVSLTIIYFIIILSIIVFIHELGHFLTAKLFGVYCYEFAIGMGPCLFSYQGKETKYAIRAIPIGGYVAMAGDDDENYEGIVVEKIRTIGGIANWKKIIVMLAGVTMNFLLAFVIFIGLFAHSNKAVIEGPVKVAKIEENSLIEKMGVMENDEISGILLKDGSEITVKGLQDISLYVTLETASQFELIRNGEKVISKKLEYPIQHLGAALYNPSREIHGLAVVNEAKNEFIRQSGLIFTTLKNLVRGIGLKHVAGPIGIVKIVDQSKQQGFISLVYLLAILSLNIGIFNLLPVPALDGGRVIIIIGEKIAGKKLTKKGQNILIGGSFALLLLIMVLASIQDITRLFS